MTVTAHNVRPGAAGFTLIEVMIAVLIVALLAAVGFPSYQDHLRKSKRAEGKAALMKAAQLQERSYTTNGTYTTDLGPLFGLQSGAAVRSGEDASLGNYNLTIAAAAVGGLQQGYTLIATPNTDRTTGGGFEDPDCNVLTLSSTGVRTYSGATTRSSKDLCW